MAENKRTFIFYSDWINIVREMPDKDAGELLKHILSYVNDEDPGTENILVKMAFGHMKPLLKDDLEKWDEIRKMRKKAGSKGGKAKAKQMLPNANQVEAVNVNVNVNDNVNVNVNDNKEKVNFEIEIHDSLQNCLKYFPDHLHPKKNQVDNWLEVLEKLHRIDNLPLHAIEKIVESTRADEFWSKNFLSLTKLRKKNRDGVLYITVFYENYLKTKEGKKNERRSTSAEKYAEREAAGER